MGCDIWGVSVPILFFSGVWRSAEGQNMVYNNRTSLFSSEIKIDFNLYLKVYFYYKGFLKRFVCVNMCVDVCINARLYE